MAVLADGRRNETTVSSPFCGGEAASYVRSCLSSPPAARAHSVDAALALRDDSFYDFLVTSRERFHRVMSAKDVDRPPLWGDGIREDVRVAWATQGYPLERALESDFTIDRREQLQPNILHRAFDLCGSDADDLELSAEDPRRYENDWLELASDPASREYVIGLRVSRGLFQNLGVRGWDSLAQLLLTVADDPARVARAMVNAADFSIKVLQRAFEEVQPDYILFSEPIASNAGPIVGPTTFGRACRDAYTRIVKHAHKCGVRWTIFQSYGHVTPLLTEAISMGIDIFWGVDTVPGSTSYLDLRRRFGPGLVLIGGIDVRLLETDTKTASGAMREIVPQLVSIGRYIPLLDGRVRPHVKYESYRGYRQTLESLVNPR